jgi:hypothetical protein
MSWNNKILWAVYASLLGVLLPHTAWAFRRFEPAGKIGDITAIAAAFAFEAAIAALTSKLASHIEKTPRYTAGRVWLRKLAFRYLNAYSLGLFVAMAVSALANLAHAVEFGGALMIFVRWGVPFGVYAVAFGGILPLVSLLFARVLSNVRESEHQVDTAELEAKATIRQLRADFRDAEQRAQLAEQRFGAAGDLFVHLLGDEKRQRIIAAQQQWPELPKASIAIIAESSPSYVSEVLSENGDI